MLFFSASDVVIDSYYGVLSSKGNRHYESRINMEQRHQLKLIMTGVTRETKDAAVKQILGGLFSTKFKY